jgi:hypothetical protein
MPSSIQSQFILFSVALVGLVWAWSMTHQKRKEKFVDRVYVGDHLAVFDNCRRNCLENELAGADTEDYVSCLEGCSKDPDFY